MITYFNPESTFTNNSSIFGMPKNIPTKLKLLPVAWEPTASFKKGTVNGPSSILKATKQMDLFHPYFKKIYKQGIFWHDDLLKKTLKLNQDTSLVAKRILSAINTGNPPSTNDLNFINKKSNQLNQLIYSNTLNSKETIGLVGGDHSCPFGLIKALSEQYKGNFSIIHIDAHFDFRNEYQGFKYSHASIMHNIKTKINSPPSIYQLGIRDFCESEYKFALKNSTFLLDQELHSKLLNGKNFHICLDELFSDLQEKIYISFDIDGMSPEFCPNTGTPVPGGINYSQATYLIQYLHKKGHCLIGFDLVEVSPKEKNTLGQGLDEVIGARILYELSCFALSSN